MKNNNPEICFDCKKVESNGKPWSIKQEPNRHATSPNSINHRGPPEDRYYEYYCSEECRKHTNKVRYTWYAELDKNASDSECFEHNHWEVRDITGYDDSLFNTSYGVKVRVGRCKITGKEVIVEPLMPGGQSGQPKECTEHFVLRKQYK